VARISPFDFAAGCPELETATRTLSGDTIWAAIEALIEGGLPAFLVGRVEETLSKIGWRDTPDGDWSSVSEAVSTHLSHRLGATVSVVCTPGSVPSGYRNEDCARLASTLHAGGTWSLVEGVIRVNP